MAYFSELPNLHYTANFPDQSFNTDVVLAKNIFKRAKLREDIANAVSAFTYYQIIDNERPDQIAEKVYNDSELDWVILTTNNITNFNNQWPLDNESFHKYLLDKYGSEEEIQKFHHYETIEVRDEYNRVVVPGGLQADPPEFYQDDIITNANETSYFISSFPVEGTKISVNLNQFLIAYGNNLNTTVPITDIQFNTSNLSILGRDGDVPITVENDLSNQWPKGWGGSLTLYGRNEDTNITIGDAIGSQKIILPKNLYVLTSSYSGNATITLVYK
jgi:hypothetical protein